MRSETSRAAATVLFLLAVSTAVALALALVSGCTRPRPETVDFHYGDTVEVVGDSFYSGERGKVVGRDYRGVYEILLDRGGRPWIVANKLKPAEHSILVSPVCH